ncbi:putative nucleic acid-binding protein [Helianthus anomalus]
MHFAFIVFDNRMTDMASRSISTITHGDSAEPIEVRVVRKWISHAFNNECCYLFGDVIQAVVDENAKKHFESKITLHYCYRVSHYLSGEERDKYNVVKLDAIIRLGKGTIFESIPDFGFPFHYFNFLPYAYLKERIDNHTILIDFIGRFVRFTFDRPTASNKRLLKFEVEDISEKFIEVSLWQEIADTIDKASFTRTPFPAILALTSMKIGIYYDLQLTSTSVTHVYLNPDNKTFSCLGSITEFIQGKSWYYKGCKKSNKKLDAKGSALACINHPEEKDPKFVYCVTAMLADNTKTTMVTLFKDVIISLIDTPCVEMVTQHGYDTHNKYQNHCRPLEVKRRFSSCSSITASDKVQQALWSTSFLTHLHHKLPP